MEQGSERLVRNLADAGCSRSETERFVALYNQGKIEQAVKLLAEVRQKILDGVHEREKRIACLDYLVYTLEKNRKY